MTAPGEVGMIVWRGWGILVVVWSVVSLLMTQIAGDAVLGAGYYTSHRWPKFVALALAAVLVWVFSFVLDARPGREVIDAQTGERLKLGGGDHLFFVPVRYWPVLLLLAGAGFGLFGPASPTAEASRRPSQQASAPGRPAPMTAVPQQVRTSLAVASGDLSGQWNGTAGSDGVHEVVVIESQDAAGFTGYSLFEDANGTAVGGRGTVSGSLIDDQITFTLARDGREFVWIGTRTDGGATLTGRFEGFSNDATYRRQ
jgi:hypothetical protein